MKTKGFTLPEMFCTMLVAGIVALMFFQIVYTTYTKTSAASKIRKFQSVMRQVQMMAKKDYNDWLDYYYEPEEVDEKSFLDRFILPYLSYISKDTDDNGNTRIVLNDASIFSIKKNETLCMDFILDINNKKLPNEAGKDLFYFTYCPQIDTAFIKQGDFIPYQTPEMNTREMAKMACETNPQFCTGFLVHEDFNFPRDYPYKVQN